MAETERTELTFSEQDIKDEGYRAKANGYKLVQDNPYEGTSDSHWLWRKGWLEAYTDSQPATFGEPTVTNYPKTIKASPQKAYSTSYGVVRITVVALAYDKRNVQLINTQQVLATLHDIDRMEAVSIAEKLRENSSSMIGADSLAITFTTVENL